MAASVEFSPEVEAAYAACELITKTEAKNFYYGIRLLPQPKRTALCAIYALARRVDDIGDDQGASVDAKRQALEEVRASLNHLEGSADQVLIAVHDAAQRFPVPLPAFGELIDGVQMDMRMDSSGSTYKNFDELTVYCRCVAGAIGRLCLSIFGAGTDPRAPMFADQLGIALQQVNILRDIREDLTNGRVYLPQDELERFGVKLELDSSGALHDPEAKLAALIRAAAQRAQDWYSLGLRLIPELDRRSAACTAAMAGIYRNLLTQIANDPTIVYERRVSLSGAQKARVAISSLARGARS